MISSSSLIFILFYFSSLGLISGIGGNENLNVRSNKDNNNYSPRCQLMWSWRKDLLKDFKLNFPSYDAVCDVRNNCSSLNCTSHFTSDVVKVGVSLSLCGNFPSVEFWSDFPRFWKEKWSHTFTINKAHQRVEILRKSDDEAVKRTKWYLSVYFNTNQSQSVAEQYVSLQSRLQICINETKNCTIDTTLISIPRLPLRQFCDAYDTNIEGGNKLSYLLSNSKMQVPLESRGSGRSSRSSSWDVDALHHSKSSGNNALTTSHMGDACLPSEIFGCGDGATCVNTGTGGICRCLRNFTEDSSGGCIPKLVPDPADAPTPEPINTNSYSAALGAIFSVIILLIVAATVFFGAKYHFISRLRNRLPLQYWPFRRTISYDDNVTMVNPLGSDDDDPPLL